MNSPRGSCTFPRVNYLSLHLPNESAVRVIKQLHFTMASSSSANTIPPVCSLVPAGGGDGERGKDRASWHMFGNGGQWHCNPEPVCQSDRTWDFVSLAWLREVAETLRTKRTFAISSRGFAWHRGLQEVLCFANVTLWRVSALSKPLGIKATTLIYLKTS